MNREPAINRYAHFYGLLLRLYSKSYYARFGGSMQQTFTDVLRERADSGRHLLLAALWMSGETFANAMAEKMTSLITGSRSVAGILFATALVLLVPLVAMQFTDEVAWSWFDFAAAFVLLAGTGLAVKVAIRRARTNAYRAGAALTLGGSLLLIWISLAVGIIGTEDDPANLMYFGVLLLGFVGAVIARFRPEGLARALFGMALAHAIGAVVARIAGADVTLPIDAVFIALWIATGMLFQRANAARRFEPAD